MGQIRCIRGYWKDIKNCQEEALKYNTRTEFMKGSSGTYSACQRNGWLDEVCSHMVRTQKPKGYWTKELCHIEALKYETKREFEENSSSVYSTTVRNKWVDEVCSHMIELRKPNGYWTKELCQIEALKYQTRGEFEKNSGSAYTATVRNKWVDEVCSHMIKIQKPFGYWDDKQKCQEEALKYTTRSEFQKNSGSAYGACLRNKWVDEVCSHMIELRKPNGYWTKELCQIEALKYQTKKEFENNSCGSYTASFRNGWLDEVCSHMVKIKKSDNYLRKKICQEEALKYTTRSEFQKNSCGLYTTCHRNGWLDEVCQHMVETSKPKNYWNDKQNSQIEANKYNSRSEFKKNSSSAYNVSLRNNWLDEVCSHMVEIQKPRNYWNNKELCQQEALKYETKREFQKNSSSAYGVCLRNKWVDEVCQHMTEIYKSKGYWTKELCQIEANKYTSRSKFQNNSNSAYHASIKNGWYDEVCKHMSRPKSEKLKWTKELCQIEALKYNTRSEFMKNSGSAYTVCHKKGWLNEICSHMVEINKPNNYWIKETCQIEALKYSTRKEFKKNSSSAYGVCQKNSWIDEFCKHMIQIGHDGLTEYNEGWVYALISPTGEIYIGMTIDLKQRFNNYKSLRCKAQNKLYNSISEHGWENFEKHILEYLDYPFKRYELWELERNYIEKYDTFNNGLNSTKGG